MRIFLPSTHIVNVLIFTGILLTAGIPLTVWGQTPAPYVPLVGIPGMPTTGGVDLTNYFNRLYQLAISLGAIIAVFKISVAGFKYAFSGVITDKASAKHDIQSTLLGLAILLIPYIVLNQIYPGLTNLDFLRNASSLRSTTGTQTSGGDYGAAPDYGTRSTTITQTEFNSYTADDITRWYGNCGGDDKFRISKTGNNVNLSCVE